MDLLRDADLLAIAPHFMYFIEDQITAIRPFLKSVTVEIPLYRFSPLIASLPYLRNRLYSMRDAIDSVESRYRYKDIEILPLRYSALPVSFFRNRRHILAARNLLKIIKRNRLSFNILHSHFLDTPGYIGAVLKEELGTPFVVTGYGWDVYDLPFRDELHRDLARQVLHKADQVIAVSEFTSERLLSLGVPPKKLHVVPNGYDERVFKPASSRDARERLNLPLDRKILLSVGSLVEVKGHTYLIEAMQTILKRREEAMLVLVGSGPLEASLRSKVNRLGLNEKILFAGKRRHEEIPTWMNACDLLVLPSLNESFGVVLIEAMACGKPVVGTHVGGVPELVPKNEVGILVPPRNPEALAEAVLEALNRTWDSKRIVKHAQRYSWGNVARQVLSVYKFLRNV